MYYIYMSYMGYMSMYDDKQSIHIGATKIKDTGLLNRKLI